MFGCAIIHFNSNPLHLKAEETQPSIQQAINTPGNKEEEGVSISQHKLEKVKRSMRQKLPENPMAHHKGEGLSNVASQIIDIVNTYLQGQLKRKY